MTKTNYKLMLVKCFASMYCVGLISGCTTLDADASHNNDQQIADTESEQTPPTESELQQGVRDVIHPEQEVIVELPPPEITPEATPEPITDVWQRVAEQFTFDIPDNKRIRNQKNWYLKHPAYMERVMNRARPFLFYIVEEIESRDMPLELTLLPIVESAFDPFAYSHGRAAGMWQFIPSTGKRFGMKQTWWYDGRRDVIASTEGAMDYLTYLYKFFDGNWMHALAAYNSGEGRVRSAIRKNKRAGKPTDFFSLDLPRETRAYVPKLLALAEILANKDEYEFAWPEVDNVAVVSVVDVGSQIDLALAADMAELELDALHALNPGYNRWATDPDGPHRLMVPLDNQQVLETALAETGKRDRLNWVRHTIRSGDSLLKLAKKYHTSVDVIREVNELRGNVIIAGEHLMVPVALKSLDSYSLSNEQRLNAMQNRARAQHKIVHTIKRGDTFWDLSREYNVKLASLAKWNGMAPADPLMPGRDLVVWVNTITKQQAQNSVQSRDAIVRKVSYKVRSGDSLSRIASKFNISTNDIVQWNSLNPNRYLQPGQTLVLHIDVTQSAG